METALSELAELDAIGAEAIAAEEEVEECKEARDARDGRRMAAAVDLVFKAKAATEDAESLAFDIPRSAGRGEEGWGSVK